MKLLVKYMVSQRCTWSVEALLKELEIPFAVVKLGEVELLHDISTEQRERFGEALISFGLALIDDKRAMLIEKIKTTIIELIHYRDEHPRVNFSCYLSKHLGYNYTYLANLFSVTEAITIEQYIILNKIERVKELILYDELNLTEISYKMHYSSVAHLSRQFKQITGLTPTFFKSLKDKRRNPLEDLCL